MSAKGFFKVMVMFGVPATWYPNSLWGPYSRIKKGIFMKQREIEIEKF